MTRRNRKPMGKRKSAAAIRFTLAGRSAIPPAARKTRARFPAGGVRVLEFAICGPRRGGGGSDPSSEGRELGPALPSRRSPREQIPGPSRRASWSALSWRENIPFQIAGKAPSFARPLQLPSRSLREPPVRRPLVCRSGAKPRSADGGGSRLRFCEHVGTEHRLAATLRQLAVAPM
jgi:hypothetical protein